MLTFFTNLLFKTLHGTCSGESCRMHVVYEASLATSNTPVIGVTRKAYILNSKVTSPDSVRSSLLVSENGKPSLVSYQLTNPGITQVFTSHLSTVTAWISTTTNILMKVYPSSRPRVTNRVVWESTMWPGASAMLFCSPKQEML